MTDKTNGEDAPNPPSSEEKAFLEDVRQYYDNPQVFENPNLPQYYTFRIFAPLLPGAPTIIDVGLNGVDLPDVLREAMLAALRLSPEIEQVIIESFNSSNWEEARAALVVDKDFLDIEQDMRRFFIRHFPKLMLKLYETAIAMCVITPIGQALSSDPKGRDVRERIFRRVLKDALGNLEKEIKTILETRTKGRPKKLEPKEGLPEIVHNVLNIAEEMMGEARGKEAVPGLKEIANKLGLTENALGKQLGRAGYSWTALRTYLENRT
ncbi:MAG TPA: hypothetical protein VF543_16295 [Pyrinomonadaceae bacterium]|jgi:hypothetical protein